ncbi:MAG: phospholipase A [Opitutaceae bacterium]|nr:phospholipase A [Opitutaceae bacterium]
MPSSRFPILFLIGLWFAVLASGEEPHLTSIWAPPSGDVASGAEMEVRRCILNHSPFEARIELPDTLRAVLHSGGQAVTVLLQKATMVTSVVPASGFVYQPYRLALPADMTGLMLLEIEGDGGGRIGFHVVTARVPIGDSTGAVAGSQAPASAGFEPSEPAVAAFQRAFTDRFSTHNPVYFVFGPDKPAAKFQFSFKYRLLDNKDNLTSILPALKALHFGYTQRSVWDITSESSPFYDSSYMPELMFEWLTPREKPKLFQWLGLQAGVQHESNGRDGFSSRSMNIAYLRPMVSLGRAGDWSLLFMPKLLVDLDSLSDNRDLRRYRGYAEYALVVTKNDNLSLTTVARAGSRWDKFSVQVDLNYPLRVKYGNFATFVVLQYWNGYGESLISYNRKSESLRAGFGLVR